MLDKLPKEAVVLSVAAGMVAGMVSSRLVQTEESPGPFADKVQIERCLDEPVHEAESLSPGPSHLDIPVNDGVAENDPLKPSKQTIQTANTAVVAVTTVDRSSPHHETLGGKGTGFIVDAGDRQLVVTAAHVIGGATLKQLKITTGDGYSVQPVDGCYVYDDPDRQMRLDPNLDEAIANVDVAVLSLPEDLTPATLSIADQAPRAGERVDFITFQGRYWPNSSTQVPGVIQDPATYTGLVAPQTKNELNYSIITGDHINTSPHPEGDRAEPGASGGPVLHDGQVVGMTYAGRLDGDRPTLEELHDDYGVHYTGSGISAKDGFRPNVASVVPASVLQNIIIAASEKLS